MLYNKEQIFFFLLTKLKYQSHIFFWIEIGSIFVEVPLKFLIPSFFYSSKIHKVFVDIDRKGKEEDIVKQRKWFIKKINWMSVFISLIQGSHALNESWPPLTPILPPSLLLLASWKSQVWPRVLKFFEDKSSRNSYANFLLDFSQKFVLKNILFKITKRKRYEKTTSTLI